MNGKLQSSDVKNETPYNIPFEAAHEKREKVSR